MRLFSLSTRYDIQLFGADAGGESAGIGGQAPAGQESAAVAQPQQKGGSSAPAGTEGTAERQAPDAGERQSPADRQTRFEELIKGEYKDLYDARVRDTIHKRLKGSEESLRKFGALTPALELLSRRYGVDSGDAEALNRAILAAESAGEHGDAQAESPADPRDRLARRQLRDWLRQAEETRSRYPSFDLRSEAGDPRFRSLLRSGVPVQTAFEVLHQNEILPAAMAYSARKAEEKLAESVIAGQLRPAEGAMGGQSPALSRRDVSQLSRAEREEIDRRVARGEKIRF